MYSKGSDEIKKWIMASAKLMREQDEQMDLAAEEKPEDETESPLKTLRKIRKLASIEIGDSDDPNTVATEALGKIAELAKKFGQEQEPPQDQANPAAAAGAQPGPQDVGNATPSDTELAMGGGLGATPAGGGQV